MGAKTGIEWTDATWNPLRGCSRVSEGCRNCYAEKVAYRFSGAGRPYEGLAVLRNGHASWTGKVEFVEKHLPDPLKWGPVRIHEPKCGKTVLGSQAACTCIDKNADRSRRIFVNSMSDLFHDGVPDEWIDRIFAVMALCPQHTFQVLTKRPERMLDYLTYHYRAVSPGPREAVFSVVQEMPGYDSEHPKWLRIACAASSALYKPLPNVWLGVSVENQPAADERIPILLDTPAAVRFLSCEPLLGPVDLRNLRAGTYNGIDGIDYEDITAPGSAARPGIDWVICGGESGPGARPMHPDWARSLRNQCRNASVPFFFKQWGEWEPSFDFRKQFEGVAPTTPVMHLSADGHIGHSLADMEGHPRQGLMVRTGKHRAGALLDGREWKQFPQEQPAAVEPASDCGGVLA
jgi:protein gp37